MEKADEEDYIRTIAYCKPPGRIHLGSSVAIRLHWRSRENLTVEVILEISFIDCCIQGTLQSKRRSFNGILD